MRFTKSFVALPLIASLTFGGAALAADGAEEEIVPAGSFSGALLAARTAERDGDYDRAVRFFREAIGFSDDENLNLE